MEVTTLLHQGGSCQPEWENAFPASWVPWETYTVLFYYLMIFFVALFLKHTQMCMYKRLEAFSSKHYLSLRTQDKDRYIVFLISTANWGKIFTESTFLLPERVRLKRSSHMEVLSNVVSVSMSLIPAKQLACSETWLWKQKHTFSVFILTWLPVSQTRIMWLKGIFRLRKVWYWAVCSHLELLWEAPGCCVLLCISYLALF